MKKLNLHILSAILIASLGYFCIANAESTNNISDVYCGNKVIESADTNTIQILNKNYRKDANNVYYCYDYYSESKIIEGADVETFTVVDELYAKDKNKVYYFGCWNYYCDLYTSAIDVQTFEILNGQIVKDKDHVYIGYQIYYINPETKEEADADSFIVLNDYYAKDNKNAYRIEPNRGGPDLKVIKGADSATFEVFSEDPSYTLDKNYIYDYGEILGKQNLKITNSAMYAKLKGKIILNVDTKGEAYYLHPQKKEMYFLSRPVIAFHVMREQGIGITNNDLEKIPVANNFCPAYSPNCDKTNAHNTQFTNQQKGKIFIQVEGNGEAWYVNPVDSKRYYLGRPVDAFNVMRNLGLGISDNNFNSLLGE